MIFFDIKSSDKLLKRVIEMDENIELADKKFNELFSDEEAFHDYQMRQLAKNGIRMRITPQRKKGKNEEND
jgi:hypothetical protein